MPDRVRTIRYRADMLRTRALQNPEGRAASLLASGTIEGDFLLIDENTHREVLRQFPQQVPWRYDRFRLHRLDDSRPDGFRSFVLAHGRVQRGEIVLTRAARKELIRRYYGTPPEDAGAPPGHAGAPPEYAGAPPEPPLQDPSATELAANFAGAVAEWSRSGFAVSSRDVYQRRLGICGTCEHWDASALMRTGKCRKCGCSGAKLWMATSKCPDAPPRW